MAHLSTGQIPAANVQLLKDGRLAPAGGLDLNGVSVGVSNADCRGPNMAEVFPAGKRSRGRIYLLDRFRECVRVWIGDEGPLFYL